MSVWTRIGAALRREKRELDDTIHDATTRANAALDRREHELEATPEEKLAIEQQHAAENGAEFDALRSSIEHRGDT